MSSEGLAWLSLGEIKSHLRIDHDHEDDLLTAIGAAAEDSVAQYIDRPVPWVGEDGGPEPIPASVRAAALLIVGDLYANREGQFVGATRTDNPMVYRLLTPYRIGMGI